MVLLVNDLEEILQTHFPWSGDLLKHELQKVDFCYHIQPMLVISHCELKDEMTQFTSFFILYKPVILLLLFIIHDLPKFFVLSIYRSRILELTIDVNEVVPPQNEQDFVAHFDDVHFNHGFLLFALWYRELDIG